MRQFVRDHAGRLLAVLLSAALFIGFLPLSLLPARAEEDGGDDSSSEFVGSFDLREIFDGSPMNMSENDLLLSQPSLNERWGTPSWGTNYWTNTTSVNSSRSISMQSDWQFSTDFTLDKNTAATCMARYTISGANGSITIDADDREFVIHHWNGSSYDATFAKVNLSSADTSGTHVFVLSYRADTKTLTATFNGKSVSTTAAACPYINVDAVKVGISGLTHWLKTSNTPQGSIKAHFNEARYTKYQPQFVETAVVTQSDGGSWRPMTEQELKSVKDGDIITIQAKVTNNYTDPETGTKNGDPVPVHLKLSNKEKYNTTGLDFDDSTWGDESQLVTVQYPGQAAQTIADVNITADGIPFSCKAGDTVVTYRAKVDNPDGKAVSIGQMMEDDFFLSCQYSGTELVPEQPLIPYDPTAPEEEQLEPGKDYHYIRTPANENGWNNGDVKIEFCPGDFDQFGITDKQNTSDKVLLDEKNKIQQYTGELSGKPVYLQAENSKDNAVSVKKEDEIKIDKTAPGLTTASADLALTDNLSGVWKLQKKTAPPASQSLLRSGAAQIAEDAFQDLQVFELQVGNGAASQNYTVTQNGVYRAVDAAGNLGAPQIISPIDPPSILRPEPIDDPDDPTGPSVLPGPVVGPEVKPDDPVPGPHIDTDEDGLKHAAVYDSITEQIDENTPLYGGNFDAADAQALLNYRYQFSANAAGDMTSELKILQNGKDVTAAGADTTTAGSFTVVYKVTDADGNTTTLYLTDVLTDPNAPPVVVYPDYVDPIVGPPIAPDKPLADPTVKKDPETGKNHAYYEDWATEVIRRDPALYGGKIDRTTALDIMQQRFRILSGQSDKKLRVISLAIFDKDGKDITKKGIDTLKADTYNIRYTVEDAAGNRVTITLHYTLRQSQTAVDIAPQPDVGDTGSGSGPQAEDTAPFTGLDDCPIHWLALLLTAAVWLYTLAHRKKHTAFRLVDGAILLLAALATGLLALMGSCPLDAPALVLCGLSVVISGLLVSRMPSAETDAY